MTNLQAFKTEINTDPAGLGYAGKADAEVSAIYRDPTLRTVPRGVVETHEILDQLDPAEYAAILNSTTKRDALGHLLGLGTVHSGSSMAAKIVVEVFGAGSVTVSNLQSFRTVPGSRADELGNGPGTPSDVADAGRL